MESTSTKHDYIILGAGAAGLQTAYECQQKGLDYLVLERETPCAFFQKYPRHRKLISINKVYTGYDDKEINLRWDWNSLLCDSDDLLFKNYSKRYMPSADDLVRYMKDFAEHYKLKIQSGVEIVHITRDATHFILTSSDGDRFCCKRLIISTGVSKENIPPVPGIELCEKYSEVSMDPEAFINQRVLVIGKGNSAFEIADNLIETTAFTHVISPAPLRLAWESRFVGDLRATNNDFLDTYQLKCQNAVLDGIITKIKKEGDEYHVSVSYTHASGEREILVYDRVVTAAGWRFNAEIFDDPCEPRLTVQNKYPEITPHFESTNVRHLFFAGTITQSIDYRKNTSSFIHGFRYTARSLVRYLADHYHDIPWEHDMVEKSVDSISDAILARINRSSAMWQQFGLLWDVIELTENGAIYSYEVPRQHALDGNFLKNKDARFLMVTLNFGTPPDKPFEIERKPNPEHAEESSFLHPVVRHYYKGELVEELHILEDLHAHWNKPCHIDPLKAFLERTLNPVMEKEAMEPAKNMA